MNKIFTILIISFSISVIGQTSVYHPFPDSNASWCSEWLSGGTPDCWNVWEKYELVRDTFLNGNLYHVLIEDRIIDHIVCNPPNTPYFQFTSEELYSRFLRQDVISKKVWFYDENEQRDKILYDFNLNVGDTLDTSRIFWATPFETITITSIDSVLIDGTYRKRFNYGGICCLWSSIDSSMIEGIGSLNGLFSRPSLDEYIAVLNKFTQDNQMLYPETFNAPTLMHHSESNCDKILILENSFISENILLYPNPTTGTINYRLKNIMKDAELEIYEMIGKKIYQQKIISTEDKISINLIKGVYIFSIIGNNTRQRVKVIVN